ncbi:unnamed protein product, partial [marine sediment metagenome]
MTDEPKSWINKNVIALSIIIVAIVASAYLYLNTTPARDYETYSRFGFSFEHPEGMELWEQGMGGIGIATTTAGIVQGTLVEDEIPEIIGVIWIPFESS